MTKATSSAAHVICLYSDRHSSGAQQEEEERGGRASATGGGGGTGGARVPATARHAQHDVHAAGREQSQLVEHTPAERHEQLPRVLTAEAAELPKLPRVLTAASSCSS